MKKALILTIVATSLLLVGELIYFEYLKKPGQKSICNTNSSLSQKNDVASDSTMSALFAHYSKDDIESGMSLISQRKKAINQFADGFLTQSFRVDSYTGVISDISFVPGMKNSFAYKVFLSIVSNKGEAFDMHLNQADLDKLVVYDDAMRTLSVNDLKKGDKVNLEIKTDMLSILSNNTLYIHITKLK